MSLDKVRRPGRPLSLFGISLMRSRLSPGSRQVAVQVEVDIAAAGAWSLPAGVRRNACRALAVDDGAGQTAVAEVGAGAKLLSPTPTRHSAARWLTNSGGLVPWKPWRRTLAHFIRGAGP